MSTMIYDLPSGINLVSRIIQNNACRSAYQPIMELNEDGRESIVAYEVLARFHIDGRSYSPADIFSLCRDNAKMLHLLEVLTKKHQFKNRPDHNKKLFVNISPYALSTAAYRNKLIAILKNEKNIVVEITESHNKNTFESVSAFVELLKQNAIEYAMDDLFQDNSLFSSFFIVDPPVIKIDKNFLARAREVPDYIEILKGLVNYCSNTSKMLIVEGVERLSDTKVCREAGVVFMQGYYFMKEHKEINA